MRPPWDWLDASGTSDLRRDSVDHLAAPAERPADSWAPMTDERSDSERGIPRNSALRKDSRVHHNDVGHREEGDTPPRISIRREDFFARIPKYPSMPSRTTRAAGGAFTASPASYVVPA
jgi:hypothetical protein